MVYNRKFFYGLISFLMIGAAACSGPLPLLDISATQLEGTQWQLNSYGPQGSEIAVVDGSPITVAFTGENKIGGTDGCNTFEGSYEAEFGTIVFHNLQSTTVACTNQGLLHQEMDYLQALAQADRYEIRGNQLIMWYGNGQSNLIFTRSHPPGQVGVQFGKG